MSITTEITAMTWEENVELDSHEEVIRKGLETFQAVGAALVAIRDGRLYRISHATFETYCQDRWSISRPQSYRLMAASEVAENLSPLGDTVPPLTNERQARALSKLEPEQQREAWVEAVATAPNGVVTAAHVQEVVEKKHPKEPKWIIDNGRTVRFSADSECLKTLSKSFGKRIDAWIVKGDLKWWGEVKTFPGGPLKDLQLAKPIPKVSI